MDGLRPPVERHLRIVAVISALLMLGGCATVPPGRWWGADATARPGWTQVQEAAIATLKDPWVWVPLAGAAVFLVDDLDHRTSDWARENTPIFGSTAEAERWSDNLRAASDVMALATLLATPSGDKRPEWIVNKAKGAAVELAAIGMSSLTTGLLKQTTGRTRPNGADDESFPSGHSSAASVSGRLAKINLDSIDTGRGTRLAADIGIDVTVLGTAWARVEAGAHYPSDVLVGIAIGNFFAQFMTEAFLNDRSRESISVTATDGGALLGWTVRF